MPKGGRRPNAGRKKGSKNKLTIEREIQKEQRAIRRYGSGNEEGPKLGKEIIERFMNIATKYALMYEPKDEDLKHSADPKEQDYRDWKRNQFKGWARLAVAWAADLAPYQSPTFRAISISPQREEDDVGGTIVLNTIEQVKQHLLSRGVPPDQIARALIGPPPVIEHDPTEQS